MKKLVLIRHGESVWNKENRFTGWTDVDLSERGMQEAVKAGELLKAEGFHFGMAFTSYLKRAIKTLNIILDVMDLDWIPVHKTWRLNEKHYGSLQGMNKSETASQYGEQQVHIWRRSYDVPPAPLDKSDNRSPFRDNRYVGVPEDLLPLTEALKDTVERILPYFTKEILPAVKEQKEVIVAAHGNSLRGIVKMLKNISDEDIPSLNLPTGVPYLFEFDDNMNLVGDRFLGDPEEIRKLQEAVAHQGKK